MNAPQIVPEHTPNTFTCMEGDRRTWAKRTRKSKLSGKMKISKKKKKYINFWWSLLFWGRYNGCHLSWWVQCGLQCWNCSTTSLLSDSFLSGTQSYSSGRAMGRTDRAESKGKKKVWKRKEDNWTWNEVKDYWTAPWSWNTLPTG